MSCARSVGYSTLYGIVSLNYHLELVLGALVYDKKHLTQHHTLSVTCK